VRVQKIVRTETRMQGVGDAQASGVLPPIENDAGVRNATAVFQAQRRVPHVEGETQRSHMRSCAEQALG